MGTWFEENLYEGFYSQKIKKNKVLVSKNTDFQKLEIFENSFFGKVLTLDGVAQTSEKDEYFYHEMFVHLPFNSFYASSKQLPQNVLIIGGGDGGILREVLRYSSVKKAIMVEIDRAVVEECAKHMPALSDGAFNDSRSDVRIEDGINFVKRARQEGQKYDIILIDSTDPNGVADPLFTDEFYQDAAACLTEHGILSTQSGVPFYQREELELVRSKLSKVFDIATFYLVPVPLYVGGFMVLSYGSNQDPRKISLPDYQNNFAYTKVEPLKYYNPEVHFGALLLPNYIKR